MRCYNRATGHIAVTFGPVFGLALFLCLPFAMYAMPVNSIDMGNGHIGKGKGSKQPGNTRAR